MLRLRGKAAMGDCGELYKDSKFLISRASIPKNKCPTTCPSTPIQGVIILNVCNDKRRYGFSAVENGYSTSRMEVICTSPGAMERNSLNSNKGLPRISATRSFGTALITLPSDTYTITSCSSNGIKPNSAYAEPRTRDISSRKFLIVAADGSCLAIYNKSCLQSSKCFSKAVAMDRLSTFVIRSTPTWI